MVIKKTTTTSGATGSGGDDGSGGTKGSGASRGFGASRGLDKASNVIVTSIGTTGTAEVVIHPPMIAKIISLWYSLRLYYGNVHVQKEVEEAI
jgi:hypothetical protein